MLGTQGQEEPLVGGLAMTRPAGRGLLMQCRDVLQRPSARALHTETTAFCSASWRGPDALVVHVGVAKPGDDKCGGRLPHRNGGAPERPARPQRAAHPEQHGRRQDGAHALPRLPAPPAGATPSHHLMRRIHTRAPISDDAEDALQSVTGVIGNLHWTLCSAMLCFCMVLAPRLVLAAASHDSWLVAAGAHSV